MRTRNRFCCRCVICRVELEGGESLVALPCKHSYHPECIDHWLRLNKVLYNLPSNLARGCLLCGHNSRAMIQNKRLMHDLNNVAVMDDAGMPGVRCWSARLRELQREGLEATAWCLSATDERKQWRQLNSCVEQLICRCQLTGHYFIYCLFTIKSKLLVHL
jgi:hypothetical protein